MAKVLFVEDDRRIRVEVMAALVAEGLEVAVAVDLAGAETVLDSGIDLVVLDRGLPDGDGLDLCTTIRERFPGMPVLMLTARDDPAERVRGLEAGADDYVVKPFHAAELIARVRSLLRRAGRQSVDDVVRLGPLWADRSRRLAGRGERQIVLRRREFDLLLFLLQHPGRPWSRDQLRQRVWRDAMDEDSRTVDVHVRRLRQQIEEDPSCPRYLLTEFGVGYRMVEPS
ncbi:MAG: response regulator transcription factor [Planctomycetota bacterium]